MKNATAPKDFSAVDRIVIGLCGRRRQSTDYHGTGGEAGAQSAGRGAESGRVVLKTIEGLTIENRLAQGKAVPEEVLEQIGPATYC